MLLCHTPAMRKRFRIFLAIVILAMVAGDVWRVQRPREPVYGGKRLSAWLYDASALNRRFSQMACDRAQIAIRQIGTNALPELVQIATAKDSAFNKSVLNRPFGEASLNLLQRLHMRDAKDRRGMALAGFAALGATAVPALRDLLKQDDAEVQRLAFICLETIGPPAQEAVPDVIAFISHTNSFLSFSAKEALGKICSQPQLSVPALTANLATHDPSVRATLMALGKFGADAKEAIPAILPLLSDNDRIIRIDATNTLKTIDPEAATKAGVK